MPPAPQYRGPGPRAYARYDGEPTPRFRWHSPENRADSALLIARPGGVRRLGRVNELPYLLGDTVVVLNTSGTFLPQFHGTVNGAPTIVYLAQMLDSSGTRWLAACPSRARGDVIHLPDGAKLTLLDQYKIGSEQAYSGLGEYWVARFESGAPFGEYHLEHGEAAGWSTFSDAAEMQNAFSTEPTSALVNSGGRNITMPVIEQLLSRGIQIAEIEVRTALTEFQGLPMPEWVGVSPVAAAIINAGIARGARILPVGTSVVRALSATHDGRRVQPTAGWVNNVITPANGGTWPRSIFTGLHESGSPHLALMAAIMGEGHARNAMIEAVERKLVFHEAGDSLVYLG